MVEVEKLLELHSFIGEQRKIVLDSLKDIDSHVGNQFKSIFANSLADVMDELAGIIDADEDYHRMLEEREYESNHCDVCGDEITSSHYHCGNCGQECSMIGHQDCEYVPEREWNLNYREEEDEKITIQRNN